MIHDLPKWDRPREKLIQSGVKSLSNSELIAVLISSGSKDESAISLASRILSLEQGFLSKLSSYEPEEFMKIKGVGVAKACSLVAAMELGRRIATSPKAERLMINDSAMLANLFMEDMRFLNKEVLKIAMLDSQSKLIAKCDISIGGLVDAAAHPREVFAPAIKKGAMSIILVHNHPSGDPRPSNEDKICTGQIAESGKLLGIRLIDHIIIGDQCYTSLSETDPDLFLLNK